MYFGYIMHMTIHVEEFNDLWDEFYAEKTNINLNHIVK